jgi:peptidyl-prolyl cis-trans isomerase SurA
MRRGIVRALLLVAILALGAAAADQIIDRVVAVVDNQIILESELTQYLQFNVGSQSALDAMPASRLDSLRGLILDELINQKVLLAKARTDSVTVETRAVDHELDSRMKTLIDQAGGSERLEQYYGMPMAKLKRQFRPLVEDALLIEKVKSQKLEGVQVGPAEVQRFWETYKDSIPPLKDGIRLAHILLPDVISESSKQVAVQRADSVRALITSGQATFEECASRFSEDQGTAANGGKLGQTNRGDLVPEYEAAAYAMQPGEISAPVVSTFGVHLIKLNERLGEKISTSHILFKIRPTAEDRAVTQARADSIIAAVKGGADFAELALKYSSDSKTASKSGDLGWLAPEELPDDFKGPLANLKAGDLAPPIRSRFGVHVVRVMDRMYARPITFEEDYDRIARMALAKKRDEIFTKWVEELAAETYIERK